MEGLLKVDLNAFSKMMSLFQGGMTPQNMMGMMGDPKFAEAFKYAQEQCKSADAETNLKKMMTDAGLNFDQMRKMFGG